MSTVNDLDVSYCDCSAACERVCCNHCGSELGVIPRRNDGASPLLATEFTERPNRPKDKPMSGIRFMGAASSEVEVVALAWWEGKRPISLTEAGHLNNPVVNCTSNHEIALAQAVAARVKEYSL